MSANRNPWPSGILPLLLDSARLPVLALLYILPQYRPHPKWTFMQAFGLLLVRWFLHLSYAFDLKPPLSLLPGKEGNRWQIVSPPTHGDSIFISNLLRLGIDLSSCQESNSTLESKLYSSPLDNKTVRPEPIGVTWYPSSPSTQDSPISPDTDVVLHFHGGAYVIGDGRDHDAGFLARGILRNTSIKYVMAAQYRLASHPGGQFPAALQDGLTCYLHLIGHLGVKPERITLSGDSAGGNLVLGLLRFLQTDHTIKLGLPQPGCAWLWSPWVDVGIAINADASDNSPHLATDYVTPLFGMWGARSIAALPASDPEGLGSATGPYLCPQRYPFKSPVPMFLHVGGHEILYHPVIDFYRRFTIGSGATTPADEPALFKVDHPIPESPPLDQFDSIAGPMSSQGPDNNILLYVSDGAPHDIALVGNILGFKDEYYHSVAAAGRFLLDTRSNSPDSIKVKARDGRM